MTTPTCQPGIGLFLGWQHSTNEIVNKPPREYLIDVDSEVAARARWRASQMVRPWDGRDLYMCSFVDPQTRMIFAQPDREASAAQWNSHRGDVWTFADARSLARWLQLYARYIDERTPRSKLGPRLPEIWREYVTGARANVAPTAIGLPVRPDEEFANLGWAGWEDWHWEPRAQ